MHKNKVRKMSRLRKKLLIYYILIAIVSISVSAEMILEISSNKLKNKIMLNINKQIENKIPALAVKNKIDPAMVYEPLLNFRNRMILFLIVISLSIITAFFLFAKDIVSPMDSMVAATKRIAAGDLTVQVPVLSSDEIGQMAGLINDMNINLQDVLWKMKQDIDDYIVTNVEMRNIIKGVLKDEISTNILNNKKMRVSDFRKIINTNKQVMRKLLKLHSDFSSAAKFIDMFKTYTIPEEITQDEIDTTIKHYSG